MNPQHDFRDNSAEVDDIAASLGVTRDNLLECQNSLLFSEMGMRRRDISHAEMNTCDWLPKLAIFQDCMRTDECSSKTSSLWIKGKPGSGKSVLMKHLVENRSSMLTGFTVISHFFHARGKDLEQNLTGFFRTILYQLTNNFPDILAIMFPIYVKSRKQRKERFEWDIPSLKMCLVSITQTLTTPTILVVDAVDECNEKERQDLINVFDELLEPNISENPIKIVLSSRHFPLISMDHAFLLNMDEQEHHDKDVKTFIQQLDLKLTGPSEIVRDVIYQKSSGVFLWVHLIVRFLREAGAQSDTVKLLEALEDIPTELDQVYEKIISGLEASKKSGLLFQWILLSKRPLHYKELYSALTLMSQESFETATVDADLIARDFVLQYSGGLVEIVSTSKQTVQFIHESVADYLRSSQGLAWWTQSPISNSFGRSQLVLAEQCTQYLRVVDKDELFRDFGTDFTLPNEDVLSGWDFSSIFESYPFLEYAASNLIEHVESAAQSDSMLIEEVKILDIKNINVWRRFWNVYAVSGENLEDSFSSKVSLLYIFATLGYPELTRSLASSGQDLSTGSGLYGTALMAAAYFNHETCLSVLLEAGSDINASCGRYGHILHTVLLSDCMNTDKKCQLLGQLINRGADIDATGISEFTALQTAVLSEFIEDDEKESLVLVLLAGGARIDYSTEKAPVSALNLAARQRNEKLVSVLVENAMKFGCSPQTYESILYTSILGGFVDILMWLLHDNIDINISCGPYSSALHCALNESGKLDRKAEIITMLTKYGSTCRHLIAAAEVGDQKSIGAADEYLTILNFSPLEFEQAVLATVLNRRVNALRKLLVLGERKKFPCIVFDDALRISFEKARGDMATTSDISIFDLLVRAYKDMRPHSGKINYIWGMLASEDVPELIWDILWNAGWRISPWTTHLHMDFCQSVENRKDNVLSQFARFGAEAYPPESLNLNIDTEQNASIFRLSMIHHRSYLVRMLLKNGVKIQESEIDLLAADAINIGDLETLRLLIDAGADINVKGQRYFSPLLMAIHYHSFEAAKTFLEAGANPNACGIDNERPITAAANADSVVMIELLIKQGATLSELNPNESPLVRAASKGYYKIVEFLLHNDPSRQAMKNQYDIALSSAVDCENTDMRIILELLEAGAKLRQGFSNLSNNQMGRAIELGLKKSYFRAVDVVLSSVSDSAQLGSYWISNSWIRYLRDHSLLTKLLMAATPAKRAEALNNWIESAVDISDTAFRRVSLTMLFNAVRDNPDLRESFTRVCMAFARNRTPEGQTRLRKLRTHFNFWGDNASGSTQL